MTIAIGSQYFFDCPKSMIFGCMPGLTIIFYTKFKRKKPQTRLSFKDACRFRVICFTLIRLRRFEEEGNVVHIVNYFKTIRIHIREVHGGRSKTLLFRHLVRMELNYKSYFGKYIYFISDTEHIEYFQKKLIGGRERLRFDFK